MGVQPPVFTSGGPDPESRLARWLRLYQAPLLLSAAFILLLGMAFAFAPARVRSSSGVRTPRPSSEPGSTHQPCPACGIGERCDKATGQCLLEPVTPPPCVEGARFDERAGYCIPDESPRPARPNQTSAPRTTPRPSSVETPFPVQTPQSTPPSTPRTPKPPTTPEPPPSPP